MSTTGPLPVVVGVDHSAAGDTAIDFAVHEARRRATGLRLVHGLVVPTPVPAVVGDWPVPGPPYDGNTLLGAAEERLGEVAARLRTRWPDLTVTAKTVSGSGGQALVDESRHAQLVVVGPRGRGGFAGLALGSVATQTLAHARCPVVVARDALAADDHRRVVVGIDGTPASENVLAFAFDAAAARDMPLISVFVWSVPQMSGLSAGTVWSTNLNTAQVQLMEAAERVSAEAMAGWQEKYPEVPVKRWTVHGDDPARVLLDAAERTDAGLLVVGSRGEGALGAALHGSVSRKIADRARTSVAVVHPTAGGH